MVGDFDVGAIFRYDGDIGAMPKHVDSCGCVAGEFFAFHIERRGKFITKNAVQMFDAGESLVDRLGISITSNYDARQTGREIDDGIAHLLAPFGIELTVQINWTMQIKNVDLTSISEH